ncbi:hypothetical protein V6617_10135 [Pelagibacterium nitratireducens]|uniref:Colicin import membrane protein n=1 Tax=Pelagibacterium nitratireducens TaxID=1046114 RepID=A0ABZ2HWA2_9HYPH
MSKPKTKKIAFPAGGIVARENSLTGRQQTVPPHKAVAVPADYADHLIHERVAYDPDAKDAPSKPSKVKQATDGDQVAADADERAKAAIAAAETKAKEITDTAESKAIKVGEEAEARAAEMITSAETRAKEIIEAAEAEAASIVKAAEEKAKVSGQKDS